MDESLKKQKIQKQSDWKKRALQETKIRFKEESGIGNECLTKPALKMNNIYVTNPHNTGVLRVLLKDVAFENKYKDLEWDEKEPSYLKDMINRFEFDDATLTTLLHKLMNLSNERKYKALQALSEFGVTAFADVQATHVEMGEKAIRGWAYVLSNQDTQAKAREDLEEFVKD